MATLDRSKPFGTVYGSDADHAYEQDGKFFDHEGQEVGGKPAANVDSAPATIKVDGVDVAIDTMEAPELHALAVKLDVKVHPNAGAAKVRHALLAAKQVGQSEDSQLNAQLQG